MPVTPTVSDDIAPQTKERLRPNPSPTKRYVRNSRFNPVIPLTRIDEEADQTQKETIDQFQTDAAETDKFIDELENDIRADPGQEEGQSSNNRGAENNNNKVQQEEPAEVRAAQLADENEINPEDNSQTDNSPETANRTVDFFPIPGSHNAVLAEAETPKTQLTIYGLTPSFLSEDEGTATAQGTLQYQLSDVHEELVPHGFDLSPERIVGARRSSAISRIGQTSATRVTYINEETKADVIMAAKAGKIWGTRQRKVEGKYSFFKEPAYNTLKKEKKTPRHCPESK